jgi:hypothetical protein
MTRRPTRKTRAAPKKTKATSAKRAAAKLAKRTAAKSITRTTRAKPAPASRRDPLDRFIDAAAQALGLPVEEAWRPAIAANLRVTLEHAASVEAFALPDDAEPGPIFKA